jgi:hypothetical protein
VGPRGGATRWGHAVGLRHGDRAEASPLAAPDLPLRVPVWDEDGRTRTSYTGPEALAARHHLSADLAARLAGIGPLTGLLVD